MSQDGDTWALPDHLLLKITQAAKEDGNNGSLQAQSQGKSHVEADGNGKL